MANNNQGNQGNQGGTSNRGFASMDEDRQREIASMGGKAAHEKGTAHEFNSQEAAEAGRKGGKASHGNRGSDGGGNNGRSSGNSNRGSSSGNRDRDSQGRFD